jgi:hypothetical protein
VTGIHLFASLEPTRAARAGPAVLPADFPGWPAARAGLRTLTPNVATTT